MAIRFKKSVKIMPGVKLNVSKSGIGVSAGVKGARISVNSKGRVTRTTGIPGTGISSVTTTNLNSKKVRPHSAKPSPNQNISSNTQNKPKQNIAKKAFGILFFMSGIYGLTMIQKDLTYIFSSIICFAIGYFLLKDKKE